MNILLRNINPVVVQRIDELAKEKGISRHEFLSRQLEMLAFFREQSDRELHLENLIDKNIQMMSKYVQYTECKVFRKITSQY